MYNNSFESSDSNFWPTTLLEGYTIYILLVYMSASNVSRRYFEWPESVKKKNAEIY